MDEANFSVVAEIARRIKREKVAEFGDDPDESLSDLMSFVVGLRNRKQLFMLVHGPGPMSARECVYLAATFMNCDELFLVADARYKAFMPDIPGWQDMTKDEQEAAFYEQSQYGPGSLSKLWEAGQREGIQECITIQRMPLIGPITTANYNYERTGRQIKWTHVLQTPEDQHSGAIMDYFNAGLKKRREIYSEIVQMYEKISNEMVHDHDFRKDEAQYWMDRGMMRYLSSYQCVFIAHYMGEVKDLGLRDTLFSKGKEISEDEATRLRNDE